MIRVRALRGHLARYLFLHSFTDYMRPQCWAVLGFDLRLLAVLRREHAWNAKEAIIEAVSADALGERGVVGGRGSIQGLLSPALLFKMNVAAVASQHWPHICAQLHIYCLFSSCKGVEVSVNIEPQRPPHSHTP